jgi:hypothetical protein
MDRIAEDRIYIAQERVPGLTVSAQLDNFAPGNYGAVLMEFLLADDDDEIISPFGH